MGVPEAIVICVDNSKPMVFSDNYKTQLEAIKLYCEAKFASNSESEVALCLMGSRKICLLLYPPTRDLQKIQDSLSCSHFAPAWLRFQEAVKLGRLGFAHSSPNKQKRMLFFAGGLTDLTNLKADTYGKMLKDSGIAVDVVNFHLKEDFEYMGPDHRFGKVQLDAFVTAVDYNGNSHIEHVEPGDSICEVLSKSILKDNPCHPRSTPDNKHVPNLNSF